MTSHIKQKLIDIRKALEKVVHDEHKPDHEEQVLDELGVLESISMTAELIKESKLGKVVSSVKDKFENISASVSSKAKHILLNWKKIVEESQKAQKPAPTHSSSSKTGESVAKFNLATYPESRSAEDLKSYISNLSSTRQAIVKIFTNCFKDSTSEGRAEAAGASIERELDIAFPADSTLTSKQYSARAKLLSFNIKKNEVYPHHLKLCNILMIVVDLARQCTEWLDRTQRFDSHDCCRDGLSDPEGCT